MLLVNIQKNWTQSAVGSGKVFWAGEVTAESFAKRKKRGELSLFRLENWKQKEDVIDVCRCQTLRREAKLSRCWLRLNESRLAMGTVRLEIKRRLLNSRAAWKQEFLDQLVIRGAEGRTPQPLVPWTESWSVLEMVPRERSCYFLGSSFTWIPLCFVVWIVCNRQPLLLWW